MSSWQRTDPAIVSTAIVDGINRFCRDVLEPRGHLAATYWDDEAAYKSLYRIAGEVAESCKECVVQAESTSTPAVSMNFTDADLSRLFEHLGRDLGSPVTYFPDRTTREGAAVTAHGQSVVSSGPALKVETVAQVEISDAEEVPTPWALVFFYVNGKRVAPPELCMMTLSYSLTEGQWDFKGWEADVYGEWADWESSD